MPDPPTDLADFTAAALLAAFAARTASPTEAMAAVFRRIAAVQPWLNAFRSLDKAGATEAARLSEQRWMRGEPAGPLDGVPFTVKDLLPQAGLSCPSGSRTVDIRRPATEDAPAVALLKAAGAIPVGRTTTPEVGWKALGDSPLTGITRNPWDPDRTPGGSSSGAAVAAATGMAPLHIGTDGGGSIRIPAAFCGIFGLKPSFGRVPAYPPSPFRVTSHVGPMTRSVGDAALMLTAMSGPDPRDPFALPPDGRDYGHGIEDGVGGLRIAVSPTLGFVRPVPAALAAVERAARRFAGLGAVVEAADPGIASPRDAFFALWAAAAAARLRDLGSAQRKMMDPGLVALAERGARLSATDLLAADAARVGLARSLSLFFRDYDLLLTPAVAVPPLPAGRDLHDPAREEWWIDWAGFSYPFNMSRQPAASLPAGLDGDGLPVGIQLVGRLYEDATVLRAARAWETAEPWPMAPPH